MRSLSFNSPSDGTEYKHGKVFAAKVVKFNGARVVVVAMIYRPYIYTLPNAKGSK